MPMNGGRSFDNYTRQTGQFQDEPEPDRTACSEKIIEYKWMLKMSSLLNTYICFHQCFFKDLSFYLKVFAIMQGSTLPLPYRVILLLQTGPGWLQAGCESCKSGAGSATRAVSGPPLLRAGAATQASTQFEGTKKPRRVAHIITKKINRFFSNSQYLII